MSTPLILRYTATSIVATSIDFTVFYALGFLEHAIPHGVAAMMSSSVGAVSSFLLQRNWVFPHSEQKSLQAGGRFLAGVLMCIALNAFLVALLSDFWSFPRLLSRIMAALCVWGGLYWFNRKVVFRA